MRLRTRLVLTLAATALPLVAGLAWVQRTLERRSMVDAIREFVLARMESGGREACEDHPEEFPAPPRRGPPRGPRGPGPGPEEGGGPPPPPPPPPGVAAAPGRDARADGARIEFFAYDPSFASANPRAPVFPSSLRSGLDAGAGEAVEDYEGKSERGTRVAFRMAWATGPAAVILAWRPEPADARGRIPAAWTALLLCAGLLLAALAAAGPVVGRIRSLTSGVAAAAADRYGTPVPVEGKDEVADLARAFNEAGASVRAQLVETERRERSLREFLANTTHDLMAPLSVLQGHLAGIRTRSGAGEPAGAADVAGAMEEAHYMSSLVHNLAAAARLESGPTLFQENPVDLSRLVERAVDRHRPLAGPLGISLDHAVPGVPVEVLGDEVLIEQAVGNLVHNALRYPGPGGHVAVVLEAPRGEENFVLRVTDDGPGVPEEILPRLGERGFRTDAARTRRPEGQGLGLSIVRGACERHGFALEFRRPEAGGLEVEVRGKRGVPGRPLSGPSPAP